MGIKQRVFITFPIKLIDKHTWETLLLSQIFLSKHNLTLLDCLECHCGNLFGQSYSLLVIHGIN